VAVLPPKSEVVPVVEAAGTVVEEGTPKLDAPCDANGVADPVPVCGDASPVSISSSLADTAESGALVAASLRADPKVDPNMDDPEAAGALSLPPWDGSGLKELSNLKGVEPKTLPDGFSWLPKTLPAGFDGKAVSVEVDPKALPAPARVPPLPKTLPPVLLLLLPAREAKPP
jgi:hypothetical protein